MIYTCDPWDDPVDGKLSHKSHKGKVVRLYVFSRELANYMTS
jgi:hypothetical protein